MSNTEQNSNFEYYTVEAYELEFIQSTDLQII